MSLIKLTDTELEVVCGGILNVNTLIPTNTGVNIATPTVAGNIFAGLTGPIANVAQGLNQNNLSGAVFAFF
jgi:hypothetical protein